MKQFNPVEFLLCRREHTLTHTYDYELYRFDSKEDARFAERELRLLITDYTIDYVIYAREKKKWVEIFQD